jgi:transposase
LGRLPVVSRGVHIATFHPFHDYKNAIDDQLDDDAAVLEAFHVVRLGTQAVDEVRRLQQQTLGHLLCSRQIRRVPETK